MARVNKAGRIAGSIMFHQIPNSEQPSILAASSNSKGTAFNACLNKKIPNAEVRFGKTMPRYVFRKPKLTAKIYSGIITI